MAELRSQPSFPILDSQGVQDILMANQDILTKRNLLCDFASEILYETCSIAGINTASLPLQRNTIFPTVDAMATALLGHSAVRSLNYLIVAII